METTSNSGKDMLSHSQVPRRKPLPAPSATSPSDVQLSENVTLSETEASDLSSNTDPYSYTPVPPSDTAEHDHASKDHVRTDHPNDEHPDQIDAEPPAEPLRSDLISRSLATLADILLCLAVASFLVLAILANYLDGKELSDLGNRVEQWARISPTLFPLVFSAIVGRSLASVARRRLEDGSSLGILEQLIGSQTVFGAISTQFILRNVNLLGIGLVLLWLISPLGGQATLRLLSHDQRVDTSSVTLAAFNWTIESNFFSGATQSSIIVPTNSLYTASLMAPLTTKEGSQDAWGNIKLPTFEAYNDTVDEEGWAEIPEHEVDWASLVGLPVSGRRHGNATLNFTLSTAYHNLECQDWIKTPAGSSWIEDNITGQNASSIWETGSAPTTWVLQRADEESDRGEPEGSLEFFWLSKANWRSPSAVGEFHWNDTCISRCSLSATFVDAQVECTGTECRVTRMKKLPSLNGFNITGILRKDSITAWSRFSGLLSTLDLAIANSHSSFTENYIYGQTVAPFQEPEESYLDMTKVPISDFTRRLSIILNTYYMASVTPRMSMGTMNEANTRKVLSGEQTTDEGDPIPVEATISSAVDVYRCNQGFFAVAVIASIIPLLLGIYGAYTKQRCQGPDVLGHFASLIRDNPYTLHTGNSTQDSAKLARDLNLMVVRLEDVHDGRGNVGHIAISSLNAMSVREARRKVPERSYR